MASFRTAYLQREVYLDIAVVGDCKVGDFVVFTAETATVQQYIKKAAAADVTAANAAAGKLYIVAQSDQTIGYGHVPVENRDYRYDPKVAQTKATAPTTKTDPWKHVALYKVINFEDVIPAADGSDHS